MQKSTNKQLFRLVKRGLEIKETEKKMTGDKKS